MRVAMELNPVYHLAETARALLVTGAAGLPALKLAATTLLFLAVLAPILMRLMRRRVLGD